jgi:hypothetical protein
MATEKSGMDEMSKKFTFSKTINGETFTANEFDSFDEAITAVNKGIKDRQLQVEKEMIPPAGISTKKEGTHQSEDDQ